MTHLLPAAGTVLDRISGLEFNLFPNRDALFVAAVQVATGRTLEAAATAMAVNRGSLFAVLAEEMLSGGLVFIGVSVCVDLVELGSQA